MTEIPIPVTLPRLAATEGIGHAFFTRQGGVSQGLYASLNCGLGSGDDLSHVTENRRRAALYFPIAAPALIIPRQIHSARAILATGSWPADAAPEGDGLVTRERGLVLGILTADCVPVLLADPVNRVIGAAHAGWRGALHGILEATLNAMISLGAEIRHIQAGIGPAIQQKSYEVGEDLHSAFLSADPAATPFFVGHGDSRFGLEPGQLELGQSEPGQSEPGQSEPGQLQLGQPRKYLCDIPAYAEERLQRAGLVHIERSGQDTYDNPEMFFSFRRATHRGEPVYGRALSAICLL